MFDPEPTPVATESGPLHIPEPCRDAQLPEHLLVVGSRRERVALLRALPRLELDLQATDWRDDVVERVDDGTWGVVLVGRPCDATPSKTLRAVLRALPHRLPKAVIATHPISDACAWRMYAAGACAVEQLEAAPPSNALHLEAMRHRIVPALLSDLAHLNVRLSAAGRLESALHRRLRVCSERFEHLELDACGGRVRVAGEVQTLDDRARLRDLLGDAPGVDAVHLDDVCVAVPTRPAQTGALVTARIDELLGTTRTIHARFERGRVVLAGAVEAAAPLQRLIAALWTTPGVQEVDDDVCVDAQQARRDAAVARAVRASLDARDLAEDVRGDLRIGVIGPFVIFQGGVRDTRTRSRMLEVALEVTGVRTVVDADGGRRATC